MLMYLFQGFGFLFSTAVVLYLLGGVVLGILIGVIPGLTATMGIALLIPMTFAVDPAAGLSLLIGIFAGGIYGGAITAILINTPGTPAAGATVLDGYPMSQKGQAGKAIALATIATVIGGLIGALILTFLAPQIARIAVLFGPPEYVLLGVYGLTMISFVTGKSLTKGLFTGCIGLLISTIGIDPLTSVPRFTFGQLNLLTGFALLPILIGIFAYAQAINGVKKIREKNVIQTNITKIGISLQEFKRVLPHIIKSGFIGTGVGAVPGTGTDIAAFLSYGEAKRSTKHPEEFGKGALEGVAAPEAGNNACVNGSMIPMFTLGIPGEAATAVILGGLMVMGLQPGPLLFTENPQVIYTVFASTITANIFILILGLYCARYFAKVLYLPKNVILTLIFIFAVLGSYAMRNSLFDVMVTIVAGIIGYIFIVLEYPIPPVLLGVILGPIVESNLGRTMLISQGDLTIFFTRPISLFFIAIILATVGSSIRKAVKEKKKEKLKEG